MSLTSDMAMCLAACEPLSTKRSWFGLGTSPQGRCQATCGKTVRYQTGYGDPDEIHDANWGFNVDVAARAEGAFWAGTPGTPAPDFAGVGDGDWSRNYWDDPGYYQAGGALPLVGLGVAALALYYYGGR
jgi:hypothetical protein